AQSMLASMRLSTELETGERDRVAALLAEAEQCARELGLVDVTARVARLQAKMAQGGFEPEANVFRCDGDVWTARYGGRDLEPQAGRGPRFLASLLSAPGREVHVLQFVAPASPAASAAQEGLTITVPGGACDDAPDDRARREYRARL